MFHQTNILDGNNLTTGSTLLKTNFPKLEHLEINPSLQSDSDEEE